VSWFNTIINFFKDGGFVLFPLAIIFVVGVTISIERWLYLTVETSRNRSLWEDVAPHLGAGNFKQAITLANNSQAQIGTVLKYGLARLSTARRRDDIQQAMEESLLEIVPRLEKRTPYLSALANIGMLVGLLGTIIALINAFGAVSQANPAEKASLLAAAISEAMNATASGLFVAITLLLTHMFLEAKTTSLIDSLEIAVVKFLNSITERYSEPAAPAPQGGMAARAPAPRPA
jgi:biopolymer transport protein ExbB/TolQ